MFPLARVFCRQSGLLRKHVNLFDSKPNLFDLAHNFFSVNTPKLGKRRRILDSSDEEEKVNKIGSSPPKLKEDSVVSSPLKTQENKLTTPVNKKSKLNDEETGKVKQEKATPKKSTSPPKSTSKKTKSSAKKKGKTDEDVKSPKLKEEISVKEEKSPDAKLNKSAEPALKIKEIKLQASGKDTIGAEYNPLMSKYHPINDAFWKKGEK